MSARNRAAKLAQTYLQLNEAGRTAFLRTLAEFDSDPRRSPLAYERLQATDDPAERTIATAALRRALEPPRVRLLTQFTTIPDGMKFLVDLRATLLARVKGDAASWRRSTATCTPCSPIGSMLASWSCSVSTGAAPPCCWSAGRV